MTSTLPRNSSTSFFHWGSVEIAIADPPTLEGAAFTIKLDSTNQSSELTLRFRVPQIMKFATRKEAAAFLEGLQLAFAMCGEYLGVPALEPPASS